MVKRRSSYTSKACGACSSRLVAIIRTGSGPPGTPRCSCFFLLFLFSVVYCFLRVRQSGVPQVRPLLFQSATCFFLVFLVRPIDNMLLRLLSPPLGVVLVSAPVELSFTFLLLLVLRWGLNSTIPQETESYNTLGRPGESFIGLSL